MLLSILFFAQSIFGDFLNKDSIVLDKVYADGRCVVRCEQGCRPGLVALFPTNTGGETAVKLLKKTSPKYWEAVVLDANILPETGSSTTFYDPLSALPSGKSWRFWLDLSNQCQQTALSPSIYLLGERSAGEIWQGDVIQIILESVTDQYLTLLEISPDHSTYIWFPSDTISLYTKVIAGTTPLTFNARYVEADSDEESPFVMPVLIRTGIFANPPGQTHFIALMSDTPRPLSDWLPDDVNAVTLVSGTKRTRIKPWQVGPGFFDLHANKPRFDSDADNLDCETWAIAPISFSVIKKH